MRIVYGPDYQNKDKLNLLIKRKNTRRKLRDSIVQYQLGEEMLGFMEDQLDSEKYKELLAKFIAIKNKEVELDPRL